MTARARDLAADARAYLASEEGRVLRERLATVVIFAGPLVAELPVLRRSRLGRLLRVAALAGLLVKGAEWLRDWEPSES